MRILTILLVLAFHLPAAAQTPGAPGLGAAVEPSPFDTALESQPPEQSGQAQQLMKEARVELDRAASDLDAMAPESAALQIAAARNALEQFEQSLEQLDQSVPGYVPRRLAEALHVQVAQAKQLLGSDLSAATDLMRELALRVTDLTAEADLLIGRVVLGSDGETIGNISNVLISPTGRILALVVDRAAPSKDLQFTVDWGEVTVRGSALVTKVTQSDTDGLPDYLAR